MSEPRLRRREALRLRGGGISSRGTGAGGAGTIDALILQFNSISSEISESTALDTCAADSERCSSVPLLARAECGNRKTVADTAAEKVESPNIVR